jgi:membrane associated rhomboid family serine protease
MSFYQYQPFSGVVRHLIIINVLMFIGTYILLGSEVRADDYPYELVKLGRLRLAAFMPGSQYFEPFQIATHMFMHGGIMHLAFNMLSLYFFGPMVEMVWGHRRFLFYYLFCGIGAYALHLVVQWWELDRAGIDPTMWDVPMLGASGAIFGIFVAFAWNFPNQVISLLFPPISLKAKYFVPIMAVLELFYGVYRTSSGVAHFAHLGGALFGIILIGIWSRFRIR